MHNISIHNSSQKKKKEKREKKGKYLQHLQQFTRFWNFVTGLKEVWYKNVGQCSTSVPIPIQAWVLSILANINPTFALCLRGHISGFSKP